MRRILVVLVLLSLGALPALVPSPAGAAPRPLVLHPDRQPVAGAATPADTARTASPISSGWVETFNTTNGDSTYLTAPSQDQSDSFDGNTVRDDLVSSSFPFGRLQVTVSAAAGQALVPGQVYGTGASGSVTVELGTVCDSVGGVALAEVDQVAFDNSGAAKDFAIQFFCEGSDGLLIEGAMAYDATPSTPHAGYYTYESDGLISGYGNDNFLNYLGDLSATPLNQPVVGMAQTPDGGGYWMVASDGGIFAFGDAQFYGSMGGTSLNKPIVGMAATPTGKGYWLVASDGGIFTFGDAAFYGSTGNLNLNRPVVGMAATPSGHGYRMVASDGGIFTFGDASYLGSTGGIDLNQPIVGMAGPPSGQGYWLVASDGGIFTFGVPFAGSIPAEGVSVDDVVGLST